MGRSTSFGFLMVTLFFLGGCSTPANIPMPKGGMEALNTAHLIIQNTQKEIGAEVQESNIAKWGGGGLIPALIDVAIENSRANDAEEAIQPIRKV